MKLNIKNQAISAFTIVELIIVMAVIAILATVTIVAYNGIQQNAHQSALMSDLDNSAAIMAHDFSANGAYAATVAAADGGNGLPTTSGTTYQYTVNNSATPPSFCLTGTNNNLVYYINSNTDTPKQGVCPVLYYDASVASSYPGSGTTWTDLSGNGNIGTLNGGVTYSSAFGGVLNFDGVTGNVSVPGPVINTAAPFSVEGWVNLSTFASTDRGSIIIGNYNGNYRGYYLNVDTGGRPTFQVGRLSDATVSSVASPSAIIANTWHYILGVYDGTGPHIYVDGVLMNSATYSPIEPEVAGTRIGGGQWAPPRAQVTGMVGSVRIYGKALNQNEITQNFNAQRGRYGI